MTCDIPWIAWALLTVAAATLLCCAVIAAWALLRWPR